MPCTLPDRWCRAVFMSPCASTQMRPSFLPALALKGRRRGHRTGAEAVIAAEHERERAFLERRERALEQLLADAGDVLDVALCDVARPLDLGNRRDDVALVDDGEAETRELLADAGDAERRRPHVGAAAIAAEVERYADDVDGLHRSHQLCGSVGARCELANCTESYRRLLYVIEMPSWPGETVVVQRLRVRSDRGEEVAHLVLLVDDVVREEQAAGVTRGNTRSKNFL